jgi:hypothetical protein
MWIKVHADGKRFSLPIPNACLEIGLRIAGRTLAGKEDFPLTEAQLRMLAKGLREARRDYGHLTLVDVETADGEIVKIVL